MRDILFAALAVVAAPFASANGADAITVTPLAPPSASGGKTLFVAVPADRTGIAAVNRYEDPRIWAERYHEFPVGAIGTGVTIADYNGDGRPDVFVVNKTDSCRLYRNDGAWRFTDVTEEAGVLDRGDAAKEWKQGATFVDVDNDGRLDIYVCRFDAPNLLYWNRGDGTFEEQAARRGLALKDASGMASFCDYDRDGWLDVFIQTNILDVLNRPGGQPNYVFRNEGGGVFLDVTAKAGISGVAQGHSATWWDYDDDGWPDLYVANDFAVPDKLYRNLRDGTFRDVIHSVVPHMPHHSMGADFADIDNDGRDDFFVADMARRTAEREQRTIAETRARFREEPPEGTAGQTMRNALYVNTGTGMMLEAAHLANVAATDWTWSPRFEDLDNDGRVDLHVTNGMVREYDNVDLRSRTMAAEGSLERVQIMRSAAPLNDTNLAFRNVGYLEFEEIGKSWGLDQSGVSFGSAFGDLDGDGDLDLVFTNYQAAPTVLRNDSQLHARLIVELRGRTSNRFGIGATILVETGSGVQRRTVSLARGYLSSSEPVAHFGLGSNSKVVRVVIRWPSGIQQEMTDVPINSRLIVREEEPRASGLIQGDSPGVPPPLFSDITEQAQFMYVRKDPPIVEATEGSVGRRFNRIGPSLVVADLNDDDFDDVVLGGTGGQPAVVAYADEGVRFHTAHPLHAGGERRTNQGPLTVFDADGDGQLDLFISQGGVASPASSVDYLPRMLLNRANRGFLAAPGDAIPQSTSSVGTLTAADYDRDGWVDLFIGSRVVPGRYPASPRSGLFRNVGGRFEDMTLKVCPTLAEAGMVTAALWTDLDDDGFQDLVLGVDWGLVRVFLNGRDGTLNERTHELGFGSGGHGWWSCLTSVDMNADGRPDIVAGNAGLNTRYRADERRPAVMFVGSFGAAKTALVEAYYESNRLVPWATRRQMAQAIPSLLKRYRSNDAYAAATVHEILSDEQLQSATRQQVTQLQSGVFISQPDGTYRFDPLPREAQLGPITAVATADFDGDGYLDVLAGQNSNTVANHVGPFAGGLGLLLRGTPEGRLQPVSARRSGFVVSGSVSSIGIADLGNDARPDVVVSRSQLSTAAFRNMTSAAGRPLKVTLLGRPTNRSAIGARVVLTYESGRTVMQELRAADGRFGGSTALYFGRAAGEKPKLIHVRWPEGTASQHAVSESHTQLEVVAPN